MVKRFVATQKEAADGVLERYSNATNSGSKTELTEMFGLPRPNSLLPMYSDASHSVSPEPLRWSHWKNKKSLRLDSYRLRVKT